MNVPEILEWVRGNVDVFDGINLLGLIILAVWAHRTGWGTRALRNTSARRNMMWPFTPFLVFMLWFGGMGLGQYAIEYFLAGLTPDQVSVATNMMYVVMGVFITALVVFIGRERFARRLKGFGLRVKTIPKDFVVALVCYIAIWPLIQVMIILTPFIGRLIHGPQFEMPVHEQLDMLSEHPTLWVQISVVIVSVVVAPIVEELLFRGLFQSVVRSFVLRPWVSVLLSSVLFVSIHADISHWPALFVLAVCLGYSYEKSGSLFRPIFIHVMFNATATLTVLLLGPEV